MSDDIEVGFGAPTPEPTPFTSLAHLAPPFPEISTMSEETPAVSPTGAPVLPQLAVKVVAALVAAATYCVMNDVFPPHTIAAKVAKLVMGAGIALGIVSQGIRK